jgi:magnesium chelatase subunit I
LVQKLGVDSLRAELTWFEAARAYAAADGRPEVITADLRAVAPMSLRLRRSQFMADYFNVQNTEEDQLKSLLNGFGARKKAPKSRN